MYNFLSCLNYPSWDLWWFPLYCIWTSTHTFWEKNILDDFFILETGEGKTQGRGRGWWWKNRFEWEHQICFKPLFRSSVSLCLDRCRRLTPSPTHDITLTTISSLFVYRFGRSLKDKYLIKKPFLNPATRSSFLLGSAPDPESLFVVQKHYEGKYVQI